MSEAVSDLNAYLSRVELDPERLAVVNERMGQIFDLARKFKTEPEKLFAFHASLRSDYDALRATADIETLRATAAALNSEYQKHASALSSARRKAALDLGKQVTHAMQTLAMEGGQFNIALSVGAASARGQIMSGFARIKAAPLDWLSASAKYTISKSTWAIKQKDRIEAFKAATPDYSETTEIVGTISFLF
jgi:DNA repair ATPase RecN